MRDRLRIPFLLLVFGLLALALGCGASPRRAPLAQGGLLDLRGVPLDTPVRLAGE